MTDVIKHELRMHFAREFGTNGTPVLKLDEQQQRQHVRVAIWKNKRAFDLIAGDLMVDDQLLTYQLGFEIAYGEPLERRTAVRTGTETDLEQSLTRKIAKLDESADDAPE